MEYGLFHIKDSHDLAIPVFLTKGLEAAASLPDPVERVKSLSEWVNLEKWIPVKDLLSFYEKGIEAIPLIQDPRVQREMAEQMAKLLLNYDKDKAIQSAMAVKDPKERGALLDILSDLIAQMEKENGGG